ATDPADGPYARVHAAAALAHDCPAHAKRLDRAEGSRWPAGRKYVPVTPGAHGRHGQARAYRHARAVAEGLQAAGTLRRDGATDSGPRGPGAARRPPHGGKPARQRRYALARPAPARLL